MWGDPLLGAIHGYSSADYHGSRRRCIAWHALCEASPSPPRLTRRPVRLIADYFLLSPLVRAHFTYIFRRQPQINGGTPDARPLLTVPPNLPDLPTGQFSIP